jgi:hypothetical protein
LAEISGFCPEDILPRWFVSEKSERIRHQLSRASELSAHR